LPFDHIYASKVIIDELRPLAEGGVVVVAPDLGSVKMAHFYAKRLGGDLAIIDKRRISGSETEVVNFIGNVSGRRVVITDDMISTAGSITDAARVVHEQGASEIYLVATHAVFCGPAIERLERAPVERVIVSDTIDTSAHRSALPKLQVASVAPLLGEAIRRVHLSESISSLFV
jgi:ribose-phosphate pyrophosphokinase